MSQTKTSEKRKVAVFFGGRSPEHDVSIVTGLQCLNALDQARYEAFPVYITTDGEWLTGDILRERKNYFLEANALKQTVSVTLDVKAERGGGLIPRKTGLFGTPKIIAFDVALPAFHGLFGEDGNAQGLFEFANIPYVGVRTKASSIYMDKITTKHVLKALDIPHLPYAILRRPETGYLIAEKELKEILAPIGFPCVIKPAHLGSSIGIAKVENVHEAKACLPAIFEYDSLALAEPYVPNLVEYNLAVARCFDQKTRTSAIERPKTSKELLDFKEKYLSGNNKGSKAGGTKTAGASEGMLSLTREINPKLDKKTEESIRAWAVRLFEALDGTGAPRIDCIGNSKTGEIWLNEVNPFPGSIGYFLWEAAKQPVLFTDLLTALIEEAFTENANQTIPRDPVPVGARLFHRPV